MFVFVSLTAEAQLFKPFTSFRVIKTEYFDIIFPIESESSARQLAVYADYAYESMSSLFGIEIPGRIPVSFAPHTDMFNGYYNPVPYPHIVLYDTPMDIEWTTFSNSLEGLFIHELAHAVSLNTRSPFFKALHWVFGGWVNLSVLNTPPFMVEGVTIAMESLSGFGRANDPLVKQKLRQAIHEEKFLSPFQASGVYDYPGQRGSWYDYGGLFSAWLIRTYGMEKYTELWQAMGSIKNSGFSFAIYRSGYYRIFRSVYNVNFIDAWNNFSASLALNNIEENSNRPLPARYHFFYERKASISAITSNGNNVYILEGSEGRIRVYNTQTENVRTYNTDFISSNDLDVSPDGNVLLVSGYHVTGERYRAAVIEHDAASGRRTGRSIQGMYKGRYFRDGVIGIRSELHNTCIVYEDFSGNREVLFRGNGGLLFSGPQVIDEERIIFIVSRNGTRELLLYNYVSKELFRIESGDSEFANIWSGCYMRGLGVSEGKIFFSHNADDRMYKLAVLNLDTMQAVFNERDFSGGIFYPVSADNSIYYRGAFFTGDNFLRFPEKTDSLSGTIINLQIVKPNVYYGLTVNQQTYETGEIIIPEPQLSTLPSKPYFGISYLNPFNLWLPLPLVRMNIIGDDFNVSLDGGGLFSIIMDPMDINTIMIMAYADIKYRMASVDMFMWQTTIPGFPLTLEFSDTVVSLFGLFPYRDTRISLSGSFSQYPGNWGYGLSAGAFYARTAEDNGSDSASAYTWKETGSVFALFTGLTFTNLRRRQNELFGTGMYLSIRGSNAFGSRYDDYFNPRIEGIFRASMETQFPLNLTLYGAYDATGMSIHGTSQAYGGAIFNNSASAEYPNPLGLELTWVFGGEVSVGLFSIEIQNNLSHAYFNRFYGTLSLRNVFYDSKDHPNAEGIDINGFRLAQSLVLNLKLVSSIMPIQSAPIFLEPSIWGAWKFSNTITGKGSQWNFGFGFNFWL